MYESTKNTSFIFMIGKTSGEGRPQKLSRLTKVVVTFAVNVLSVKVVVVIIKEYCYDNPIVCYCLFLVEDAFSHQIVWHYINTSFKL